MMILQIFNVVVVDVFYWYLQLYLHMDHMDPHPMFGARLVRCCNRERTRIYAVSEVGLMWSTNSEKQHGDALFMIFEGWLHGKCMKFYFLLNMVDVFFFVSPS